MNIPAPKKNKSDPDYAVNCQIEMAVWFNALIDLMKENGWDAEIVDESALVLALANLESSRENSRTQKAIDQAQIEMLKETHLN